MEHNLFRNSHNAMLTFRLLLARALTRKKAESTLIPFKTLVLSLFQKVWSYGALTERERGRGKKTKLRVAVEIHRMITDAMRVHPDIKHLHDLTRFYEEVKVEYELAKKSGFLPSSPSKHNNNEGLAS